MYKIHTVNPDETIAFAAQELKKYLRMMMPRVGEIPVSYNKDAQDGFRLGLMADFGLDPDVENLYLDDVIYVKTDAVGGVIAGSNVRSVLQAVYRFLKKQGCIWLFPGSDGEKIPMVRELKPVDYLHKAPLRYRGQCNEGSELQPQMMDAIDFTPKIGLNTFMMEGDEPVGCYNHFYCHMWTDMESEGPISKRTALQWKRVCDAEIDKRGLMLHDMGHGWTSTPFGFRNCTDLSREECEEEYKKEKYQHAALLDGKRHLFGDFDLNTNVCMSRADTRDIIVQAVADYCEKQNHVDYLHVWLSDGTNNHCECEECKKKVPSDWYIILMNEIDAELTKRGLDNHIVFICYVDTFWAPQEETIHNPERFALLFAPIKRYYTETYGYEPDMSAVVPYNRNHLDFPRGMAANLAYLQDWKRTWKHDVFCYEYYFWRFQWYDMGGKMLARVIYEDAVNQRKAGLCGMVADGSQRAFFPNGFCFYVYGEAQYDPGRSFAELEEEYFSAAYGEDWRQVVAYLDSISERTNYLYLCGHESADPEQGAYYNPAVVPDFEEIARIVRDFRPVIDAHFDQKDRCKFVSWEALKWHSKLLEKYTAAAIAKATNRHEEAWDIFMQIKREMTTYDLMRCNNYDHFSLMYGLNSIFKIRK